MKKSLLLAVPAIALISLFLVDRENLRFDDIDIITDIETALKSYNGTQSSFSELYFPDANQEAPLHEAIVIPNRNDPFHWQVHRFKGSILDQEISISCDQYGPVTQAYLREIGQLPSGKTHLDVALSSGFDARLDCEFRFTDLNFSEHSIASMIEVFEERFSAIDVSSPENHEVGGFSYIRHSIKAFELKTSENTMISRLRLRISDFDNHSDSILGDFIVFVGSS